MRALLLLPCLLAALALAHLAALAGDAASTPTRTLWALVPAADEDAWLKDATYKTARIFETDGDAYTRQDAAAVTAQDWHRIGSQLEADEKTTDVLYRASAYAIAAPKVEEAPPMPVVPPGDIAKAPAGRYLWAVVPASVEKAWCVDPNAPEIAGQWRCYELGPGGAGEVKSARVAAKDWRRVGSEERSDGSGEDADFRADCYVIGGQ